MTTGVAEVSPCSASRIESSGRIAGATRVAVVATGGWYVGGYPGGVYWVPASAYPLFLGCGDLGKKAGTGDCADVVEVEWCCGVSSRRDEAPLTWGRNRGEWECEEAEVRREACWYGRACA